MTFDGVNTYLYDAESRVCAVHGPFGMTGYQYDADGNRIGKGSITSMSCDLTANGYQAQSEYVLDAGGGQMSEMAVAANGSEVWQHTNVTAGGTLIATYDTTGLHFYLNDALGTRRAQTDGYGVLEQTCQSLPFGDGLNCSLSNAAPTEHHFTGKERDAESGLDYFGARYYASSMGRFMSPDWAAKEEPVPYASLDNPQTLNLYQYMRNNPLGGVDPDGHCCTLDQIKTGLDVVGFVPVVGDVANAASGAISLAQGHYGEAALSFAAAIPVVGVLGEVGKGAELLKDAGVLANRAQGLAGEAKVGEELVAEGTKILGSHVGVQTEEGLRVVDHLVSKEGKLGAVEVKTGEATRTASQVAKDESMAEKGGKIVGKNAPPELRGQTVKLPTEVRKPQP